MGDSFFLMMGRISLLKTVMHDRLISVLSTTTLTVNNKNPHTLLLIINFFIVNQVLITQVLPHLKVELFGYCSSVEESGSAVDGIMVMLVSFCFERKITIVSSKMIWTMDDDLANHDVIIAYYSGQFMVCKVGKYISI